MSNKTQTDHPVDDPVQKYRDVDRVRFEQTSLNSMENPTAIIYARVSSDEQAVNGKSISSQIEDLKKIAQARGISVIGEPIVDPGFSGLDFSRPGIREIIDSADDHGFDYLMVSQVDRLGRNSLQTLNLIGKLRTQWDVRLFTDGFGELDFARQAHQPFIISRCAQAQLSNESRTQRAQRGVIQSFKNKNWTALYDKAPFGYRLRDDGWIEPDPRRIEDVSKIFGYFLNTNISGAYTKTAEHFPKYRFSLSDVKQIVSNEIYLGYAIAVIRKTTGLQDELFCTSIYDESLRILSDDIYEQAQEKINRIENKYTSEEGQTGIDKFSNSLAAVPALDIVPELTLVCENCGHSMVKDGNTDNPDQPDHRYHCSECGTGRRFPRSGELSALKSRFDRFE